MTLYIDNPWDDVRKLIEETVIDYMLEQEDAYPPTQAEREWIAQKAKGIAQHVMGQLDGSECEADGLGLRKMGAA